MNIPHKNGILAILALTLVTTHTPLTAQPTPPIAGDWTLQFEDNFDGTSLDGTKWRQGSHHAGIAGSGGNSPNQISVGNGVLRLEASTDDVVFSGTNYSYSTGEVTTFKKFRYGYGYYEARIKCPAVQGLWPAFWLMPDRSLYGAANQYSRSFLKFDLTGVSPGTITSAQLILKAASVEANVQSWDAHNLLVMKVLDDDGWSEGGVKWSNQPAFEPLWLGQHYNTIVAGNTVSTDVTAYVQEQMSGDKKISFALVDNFMRTKKITFYSREVTNAADRPRLVINGVTYYPDADAYVYKANSATNYGSASTLWVEDGWDDTASTFYAGMEVDIMESLGVWGANKTQHALHWDGYYGDHQSDGSEIISYSATGDGFHTFGLYWEDDLYEFYVDGAKTWSWAGSRVMYCQAYILLSLQLGGWGGNNTGSQVNGQAMEVDYVRVWSGTKATVTQAPYGSTAATLPGTVQAENFDTGGEGLAYHDTTFGNTGGAFRTTEDVDISNCSDTGGGYNVSYPVSGEWLEYTVNAAFDGLYDFDFRVASTYTGSTFSMDVDGTDVTGTMAVPNTGGWQTWQTVTASGVYLTAGTHVLRMNYNSTSFNFNYLVANLAAVPLPGSFEAEDFDEGGEGVTYHDTTSGNSGGQYRSTDVDISSCTDTGGGYNISYAASGEWLEYTVYVAYAGAYDFDFRIATTNTGSNFWLDADGTDVTGLVTVPNTGGWQTWQTLTVPDVPLSAGSQVLRFNFNATAFNLNRISATYAAVLLPGLIQAEDFDEGGEGVTYHDTTSGNSGGQYRSTDVDIANCTDTGGGYNIGYVADGEWLEYSVYISSTGTYDIHFRVAAYTVGSALHLEVDGTNVTGSVATPNTGGWQVWQTVTKPNVNLTTGPHTLRIVFENSATNLNWFSID